MVGWSRRAGEPRSGSFAGKARKSEVTSPARCPSCRLWGSAEETGATRPPSATRAQGGRGAWSPVLAWLAQADGAERGAA